MRTRTAPRKKNLLEPVFSVNYFPGHKFHYKSQATPGIRTGRNELLQVESHSAAPDHVSGQSGAGGVLPHAQVTRLRPGTGRPSVAEDGRVRRPCPNQPGGASPRSPRSDNPIPCLVPHTGNGATVVRGLVSTRRGSEESGTNPPFWPGACATRLQHAAPFGSCLQGPGVNLRCGHGDETVEDVLRDEGASSEKKVALRRPS